ncbi:MAG: hypothetical protein LJE92_06855 [Gammaproteobacteria bacterium]|jgi:hypothetical protein|nr:hypothetical protein [Gammaproteobacteria bacterium]
MEQLVDYRIMPSVWAHDADAGRDMLRYDISIGIHPCFAERERRTRPDINGISTSGRLKRPKRPGTR